MAKRAPPEVGTAQDVRRAFLKAQALPLINAGRTGLEVAAALGVSRETLYDWRTADPTFARAWNDAFANRITNLEDIALKRAETSDQVLMFLLRGGRPDVWGDRKTLDITQRGSLDVTVLRALPLEDLMAKLQDLREQQKTLEVDAENVIDLDEHR